MLTLPAILTPEIIEGIRWGYANKHPLVMQAFEDVYLTPAWDYKLYHFYRFIASQDRKWLDAALAAPYKGKSDSWREPGIENLLSYALLEPHMSDEQKSVGREFLIEMMEDLVWRIRSFDADERDTAEPMARMADALFGTDFLHAGDPDNPYVNEWEPMSVVLRVNREMMTADRRDGLASESGGYMLNTRKHELTAIGAIGYWLPGHEEWLDKYREFFLRRLSQDLQGIVDWGDTQLGNYGVWAACPWYTIPQCWQLMALGKDADGEIAKLSVRLLAAAGPQTLHTIFGHLMLDPRKLPTIEEARQQRIPTGTTSLHPGITFRHETVPVCSLFTVQMLAPLMDDHDAYASGGFSHTLYADGDMIWDCPVGYGLTYRNYNSVVLHGNPEWINRGTIDCHDEPDGTTVVVGQLSGPMPTPYWETPDAFEYHNDKLTRTYRYKPEADGTFALEVTDAWATDGFTPDASFREPYDWYPHLVGSAVAESRHCIPRTATREGNTFTWHSATKRRPVTLTVEGAEEILVENLPPNAPWLPEFWAVVRLRSNALAGTHRLRLAVGVPTVTPPPVVPPPPPVEPPPPSDPLLNDNPTLNGDWVLWSTDGYGGNLHYAAPGQSTAHWTFATTPGVYRVLTTWPPYPNRATNAKFVVGDKVVRVNQEQPPGPQVWYALAEVEAGESLTVTLDASDADEFVIADAVRIERIGDVTPPVEPPPPPPPAKVEWQWLTLPDGRRGLFVPVP